MTANRLFRVRESWVLPIWLCLNLLILFVIHLKSDIPVNIGQWAPKAHEILSFHFPTSNFYGPGAALFLIPFLWLAPHYFYILIIYFLFGAICFWKICEFVSSPRLRFLARCSLPLNIYLIWIINSGTDTVFEFSIFSFFMLMVLKRNSLGFIIGGVLLAETRSAYWLTFIVISLFLALERFRKERKIVFKFLVSFPVLLIISISNFLIYNSPSPALEAGVTAYYSYTKFHYLALPKMDMDVFLDGQNGPFSNEFGPDRTSGLSEASLNRLYLDAAKQSLIENPEENFLGLMQKFDSYIFDVQKIPQLPGKYVLNMKSNVIEISDSRLSWSMILGYFAFEIWRSIWLVSLVAGIGVLLVLRRLRVSIRKYFSSVGFLALPWIIGVIPGLLFYTETRFKILAELILVPFIAQVFSLFYIDGAIRGKTLVQSDNTAGGHDVNSNNS